MSSGKAPKTVLDKIEAAIAALKDAEGSSRIAIAKYVKAEFGLDNGVALKKAFKAGVDKGKLVQKGQSFLVKGLTFAPPADEALGVEELKAGKEGGKAAAKGDTVTMKYVGTLLADGSKFDSSNKFSFTLGAGEVIKGWDRGIAGMLEGSRRRLTIPPKLGYGKRGSPPEIPGDATLVFDVTLLQVH